MTGQVATTLGKIETGAEFTLDGVRYRKVGRGENVAYTPVDGIIEADRDLAIMVDRPEVGEFTLDGPVVLAGVRPRWRMESKARTVPMQYDTGDIDPAWRHTDNAGHRHSGDSLRATLRLVVDQEGWCNGECGSGEPHSYTIQWHWECLECGETVKPRRLPFPHTENRQVGVTVELTVIDGARGGRSERTVILTDEEAVELQQAVIAVGLADQQMPLDQRNGDDLWAPVDAIALRTGEAALADGRTIRTESRSWA